MKKAKKYLDDEFKSTGRNPVDLDDAMNRIIKSAPVNLNTLTKYKRDWDKANI